MTNNKQQIVTSSGKIMCDRSILVSIISLATKEISGVHSLQNNFKMRFRKLFKKGEAEGVCLKFVQNKACIDIFCRIYVGYNVPDIAYKIQENIKNNISSMVEVAVGKINIHIVGVEFSQKKEEK